MLENPEVDEGVYKVDRPITPTFTPFSNSKRVEPRCFGKKSDSPMSDLILPAKFRELLFPLK